MVNLWWDCGDFVVNGWSYFWVEKHATDSGFIFWGFPFWEWVLDGGAIYCRGSRTIRAARRLPSKLALIDCRCKEVCGMAEQCADGDANDGADSCAYCG